MPALDHAALTSDPEGLALLADVLGTADVADQPGRRFPAEAWTPPAAHPGGSAVYIPRAPASETLLPEMA